MWLYSSQDEYNFVSKMFLKSNLSVVKNAPSLRGRFVNDEALGTAAYAQRQWQIEDALAQRVAAMHNWGDVKRVTETVMRLPPWVQDYVNEFTQAAGRGNWRSLRCSDDLGSSPGLRMQTLTLK